MSHTIGGLDPATREALQALGSVIRELRAARGLTQRALAARCGLSQPTISRLECGRAEGLRAAWIARLLAGLDSTVRVLPDDRPVLERCHGFLLLRRAFAPAAGEQRRRARDDARRKSVEAYIASLNPPIDRS